MRVIQAAILPTFVAALALAMPAAAQQGATTSTTTAGDLPSGSLPAKRDGAIGTTPEPVVQGGAGNAAGPQATEGSSTEKEGLMDEKALSLMGKPVRLSAGGEAGTVDDVVLDERDATASMLVVATAGKEGGRKVAVPAGQATLDDQNSVVVLEMDRAAFDALPPWDGAGGEGAMGTMVGTPGKDGKAGGK